MGTMGLGILGAAQAQPYGVNRYSLIQNAMQQANQGLMQSRMYDMQKEQYDERKKDRMSQKSALAELVGGYDPKTGIDWETGRAGTTPGQQQQTAIRAFPEQAGAAMVQSMFPTPTKPKITDAMANAAQYAEPGTPEYRAKLTELLQKKPSDTGTYTYKNFVPSGGTEAQLSRMHSKSGQVEVKDKDSGIWRPAPRGSFVGQTVDAPSVGELTDRDRSKQVSELTTRRTDLAKFLKSSTRMLAKAEESGDESLAFVGGTARLIDNLQSQFSAGVRAVTGGKKTTEEGTTLSEIKSWAEEMDWAGTLAADSASVRSQISSLAYTLALAKNGTRPTDEDVRFALKMLAGNSGSNRQLAAATQSMMREGLDNYMVDHQEVMGEQFDMPSFLSKHQIALPGQGTRPKLLHLLNGQEVTEASVSGMGEAEIIELLSDENLPEEFAPHIQDRMRELGMTQ
jgi:hypothetical protein